MTKNRIITLATSQLLYPDITLSTQESVNAFARAANVSVGGVKAILAFDEFALPFPGLFCNKANYIRDYKMGRLTSGQFCDRLRDYRFFRSSDQLSNDTIKDCWNIMCKIHESQHQKIKDFIKFLDEHQDYIVVFVNETNEFQANYIQKQIAGILTPQELTTFNARTITVNSHEQGYFGKGALAKGGIKEAQEESLLPPNNQIEAVISLHGQIKSERVLETGSHAASVSKTVHKDERTTPSSNLLEILNRVDQEINQSVSQLKRD